MPMAQCLSARANVATTARPATSSRRRGCTAVRVRAVASRDPESSSSSPAPAAAPVAKQQQALQLGWSKFMQRYEQPMLSSGVGAAVVTTYCMAHGQEPGTAAAITVAATITALVLNELLFSDA